MTLSFRTFSLCTAALLLLLAGCRGSRTRGAATPQPPQSPQLIVQGSPDLNSGGNAATVRIYQLANDTNFLQTSIEIFWRDDAAALGDELVATQRVVLYPDQAQTIALDLKEGTRFIGVAVDLREPDRDRWRAIYPMTDLAERQLLVNVGRNELSLNVQ